jgi:hypothetical protein
LNRRKNFELILSFAQIKSFAEINIFTNFFRKIYHDLNMSLADKVREYDYENYIKPTRDNGQNTVTIKSGDIHDKMGLENKIPSVCGALDTKKFQKKY